MAPWPTIVAHLDLDCFFAQVVELDHPEYRGRPVIVGGGPRPDGSFGRGVVCTSNYLARSFGVRTAMPIAQAARLRRLDDDQQRPGEPHQGNHEPGNEGG